MKKRFIFILSGVMAMSLFTGFGKSEEEKAMDEIASHMIDEAAEDGVDLDKLLEEEYASYEERHAENVKEMEERKDFALQKEEAAKKPISAYEAYKNAATSEDIIAKAKEYNEAYEEYLKLADGDPEKENILLSYLRNINPDLKNTKILESIYEIKAAYVDFAEKENYDEARFYYNLEEDSAYIALTGMDEATYAIDEILVLKRDGSVCEIDLESVMTPTTSLIQPLGFEENSYIIFTVDNAEYKYWEFDINDSIAKGTATTTDTTTYTEHWFNNTLEELNFGEPAN